MQIGIILNNPWALALVPVLVAFIIITSKKLRFPSILRKRLTMILRIILVLVLTIAIASPSITARLDRTGTIFIADVSDSLNDRKDEIQAFIDKATGYAAKKDVTGVITFASEAAVAKMPDDKDRAFSLNVRIKTDGTDIGNALTMSRSIMPENTAKRLVLLTDGKETSGDALETARLLNRLGYTLDVVHVEGDTENEVQIEEFTAPKQVNAKERFDVSVKINSNVDTKATIRLFENRTLAAEKDVALYTGENLFTFTDTAEESGMVTYTAEVITDNDTVLQNNQLSSFTQILDQPRILLVERENSGENLVRFIEEYAQITRVKPSEVPVTMQGIIAYDAFVLVDISYEWLDEDFSKLLEQVVRHQGKGLLAIGGENSYAPGGYNGTPLETILPVNMDISQKEENPDLGLALVIDKSGSMASGEYGITKLELAKEAAIRATEVLEQTDQLGVIAFDDAIQWVIRTEPLTNKEEAADLIGSIRPGGGTQILPPLIDAWQDLRTKDTKLKHIILLTDGQAERYGYERVIEGINEDGITLSTVAVGQGADTLLLKALAYGGMGRYYQTDEFSDIPSIFAKEAFLAGQKYLQNRHFYPELVTSMGLLKGIEALPPLDGYVATKIKPAARTVFRSDAKEPVLSVWQYGLGRTAAWTSDIQGIWTSQWSMWQDAPVFWGNLTGWLVQKNLNSGFSVSTGLKNGKGVITLTADTDYLPQTDIIEGTLVSPDGASNTIKLNIQKPGVYEGEIEERDSGAYIVNLQVPTDNGTQNISTGIVLPYSDEYRLLHSSKEFLQKLAKAGGGRIISEPEAVFSGELQNTGGRRDITKFLIVLSLILLLLDIAFRKLQISLQPILVFFNKKIAPIKDVMVERLSIRKETSQSSSQLKSADNPENSHDRTPNLDKVENNRTQKEKTKKKPEEKPRASEERNDHINALLQRRKKWK